MHVNALLASIEHVPPFWHGSVAQELMRQTGLILAFLFGCTLLIAKNGHYWRLVHYKKMDASLNNKALKY